MKEITKKRIRRILEKAVADGTTAGASVLVRKDGEELLFDACGMADVEGGKPIVRDTIFRMYSMSKPVTAVAVMILMEQGRLDLSEHVCDMLPGYQNLMVEKYGGNVPVQLPMTVLHLLNMTSGLTYGNETTPAGREVMDYLAHCEGKMFTEDAVTTLEFANHLGEIPLSFDPDTSWCYSLSADVLGAIVEKVSGMRFGDFLKQNIFEPLGMKDTDFWVPEEKQERFARAYESVNNNMAKSASAGSEAGEEKTVAEISQKKELVLYKGNHLVIQNSMEKRPAFESGGAGLVSTIDDYARFAQMLLNGGELDGIRILTPQTVEFLTSGELTPAQEAAKRRWVPGLTGFTYHHLLRRMVDPGQYCGLARMDEYGWDGWLGCYFANFPNEKMTILLMQQKKDSGTIPMTRKIRNVILSDGELFG